MDVVSLSLFRGNVVLVKSGAHQYQLYGVERCPLLRGLKCVTSIVKSIGGK